jgi:hypothetical protein
MVTAPKPSHKQQKSRLLLRVKWGTGPDFRVGMAADN